jgi:hypothetical protein
MRRLVRLLWSALPIALLFALASNRSAHAQVPDGFTLDESHKAEFTIALPQGWTIYDQGAVMTGKPSAAGMLIFSATDIHSLPVDKQLEIMGQIDTGEAPAFFVDRQKAKGGASCASFPEKTQKDVAKLVQKSFSGTNVKPPVVEAATVGGCQGLHVRLDVKLKDGTEWVVDVRAVSTGTTLYLFSLRNHKDNFEKNLEAFEKSMATLKMTGSS